MQRSLSLGWETFLETPDCVEHLELCVAWDVSPWKMPSSFPVTLLLLQDVNCSQPFPGKAQAVLHCGAPVADSL